MAKPWNFVRSLSSISLLGGIIRGPRLGLKAASCKDREKYYGIGYISRIAFIFNSSLLTGTDREVCGTSYIEPKFF